jgi:hypothetical protein
VGYGAGTGSAERNGSWILTATLDMCTALAALIQPVGESMCELFAEDIGDGGAHPWAMFRQLACDDQHPLLVYARVPRPAPTKEERAAAEAKAKADAAEAKAKAMGTAKGKAKAEAAEAKAKAMVTAKGKAKGKRAHGDD